MTPSIFEYIKSLSSTDAKSLSQKALKTAEEVGELAKVVLPYENAALCTHRFVAKERILEEVADTILCALSIGYDLGYSHEEIGSMMMHKAQYWAELQQREGQIVYPLPYEIHITIKGDGCDIESFKSDCAQAGVKPLLIDLHNREGQTVMLDLQTSSVHMGDNRSAYLEANRIATAMAEAGYTVLRSKIETVPWHPAAPSAAHSRPAMPPNCYFEAHFNIVVDEDSLQTLRGVIEANGAHLSRNVFKRITTTQFIMMATMRQYEGTFETFKDHCAALVAQLERNGFDVPKTITEFSIYDTRVSHDAAWLTQG